MAKLELHMEVKSRGWTTGVDFVPGTIEPITSLGETLVINTGEHAGTYEPILYHGWTGIVPSEQSFKSILLVTPPVIDVQGDLIPPLVFSDTPTTFYDLRLLLENADTHLAYSKGVSISVSCTQVFIPDVQFLDKTGIVIKNTAAAPSDGQIFQLDSTFNFFQHDDTESHGSPRSDSLYWPFLDVR